MSKDLHIKTPIGEIQLLVNEGDEFPGVSMIVTEGKTVLRTYRLEYNSFDGCHVLYESNDCDSDFDTKELLCSKEKNFLKYDESIFDEIQSVDFNEDPDDEVYEVISMIAQNENKRIAEENGGQISESMIDETVYVNLHYFNKYGLLHKALKFYYDAIGKNIKEEIRDYLEYEDKIYFTSGTGANKESISLLGGDGDKADIKKFIDILNGGDQ